MGKQIPITPEVERAIRQATGDAAFDTSQVVVFEARTVTTEPISQGGFFNGARSAVSLLIEMAKHLTQEGAGVPLLIMHDGGMLPIGRVFRAEVFSMPNGENELRSMFYVPKSKTQLVEDIENSVIDEVSVGLTPKHAFCSECGFDYLGKDASFENFFSLECNNGHNIGVDGVHVRLVGLDSWDELSLVNRGAAKEAKILPQAKQKLGNNQLSNKLAANGLPKTAFVLKASFDLKEENSKPSLNPKTEEKKMPQDENALVQLSAALADEKASGIVLKKENETLTASLAQKEAELKAANDKIAALEAASADAAGLVAAKEKAENELKEATDLIAPHVKAALTASGVAEDQVPAELPAMVKLVEEKGLKLHQIVGAGQGGTASGTKEDAGDEASKKAEKARMNAFKLNKRKE